MVYLGCEAVAAWGFSGYSYATHYISDLGVPYPSEEGRTFDSRLAPVMNIGFVVQGVLLPLGVVWAVRGGGLRPRGAMLALGALYAVGLLLVATVHGGPREAADGTGVLHVAGAGAAIIAGNVVALVAGRVSRQLGARASYRAASTTLGAVGLLSLLMLVVDSGTTAFTLLPDGVWERGSVYPINAWQLLTGFALLAAQRGASQAQRGASQGEPSPSWPSSP